MRFEALAAPPASVQVSLFQFAPAQLSICAFVKRTYDLVHGQRMSRSSRREIPLNHEPAVEDGNGQHPVKCQISECDLIPRKPCTDIVIHGHARSPGTRPVTKMIAAVQVGQRWKRIAVLGDRRVSWRPGTRPRFAGPEPFVELPLTWRRAFGGIDGSLVPPRPANVFELLSTFDPELHPGAFPRNPAGVGWVVNADERMLNGLPLPNFELPEHPLTPDRLIHGGADNWVWAPEPAGFGWVSQTWFPRSTLLGVGPEHASLPHHLRGGWLELAPHSDAEPDPRFYSGAPSGLRRSDLKGDELVEMHGFHHHGPLSSALPDDLPHVVIAFRRRPLEVTTRLHTIELFPDDAVASLLWVASAAAPPGLPLTLPSAARVEQYDLLEGVDVLLDGVALPRHLLR